MGGELKEEIKLKEGWTYLFNDPKWHYFRDNRSLCKKWGLLRTNDLEPDMDSSDNCKACAKKRKTELEKNNGK